MAIAAAAGPRGADVRNDAWVAVRPGAGDVTVRSTVASLYGQQIEEQIRRRLAEVGDGFDVEVEDTGAFPAILDARLETAFRRAGILLPFPFCDGELNSSVALPGRLRSRLYLPGDQPKLMASAGLFGADGLILDLEDAVADGEKDAARILVRNALAAFDFGGAWRLVRINAGPEGAKDLNELLTSPPDGIVIPKVESREDVCQVAEAIPDVPLLPIIESALGIENAFEICASSPRIRWVTLGAEDYARDLGVQRGAGDAALDFAWGRLVNAAVAARVTPLASVFSQIDDEDGLASYARRMRERGLRGVGCLHPRQVAIVHQALLPSPKEQSWAAEVVAAYEASGGGVTAVRGQMVDLPVYERARDLLADVEEASWRLA